MPIPSERLRRYGFAGLTTVALLLGALAAGAQTNEVTANHPAVEAIVAADFATVQKLLGEGLDPNGEYAFEHPRWNNGQPTKMWLPMVAAMFGRLDTLQALYAHPKFRTSKEKNTHPLCMAISHRHPEVALFLIAKDVYADPPGGCTGWFSPMSRAKEQELDDVVAALRKAGG